MLRALPYTGAKARGDINDWIQARLPEAALYCEPFAGMLNILLNRKRSRNEIVSDANGHIMTWWRAVRDYPEELARRMMATPFHRAQHRECYEMLFGSGADETRPAIDTAWAVTVVIADGLMHVCSADKSDSWAPKYGTSGRFTREGLASRFAPLADRIREVQFESWPAERMLVRTAGMADAMIYCDPPYVSRPKTTIVYGKGAMPIDVPKISELLLAQKGKVAISGYDDEWSHLGWECATFETEHFGVATGDRSPRREKLWTNYQAEPQLELF